MEHKSILIKLCTKSEEKERFFGHNSRILQHPIFPGRWIVFPVPEIILAFMTD
jgi:hypothetical protein